MTATLDSPRSRTATPILDREELLRYGRHLILPAVAIDGQRRLSIVESFQSLVTTTAGSR